MFRLVKLSSPVYSGWIYKYGEGEGNAITIIAGENGAGKSKILAGLAESHLYEGDGFIQSVDQTSSPNKVVAQTFSPFSKFPQPYEERARRRGVEKNLFPEEHRRGAYEVVGFHKRNGLFGASITKNIVEGALQKIAGRPEEKVFAVSRALSYLGYEQNVRFNYSPSMGRNIFLKGNSQEALKGQIVSDVNRVRDGVSSGSRRWLYEEIELHGMDEVVGRLLVAFNYLLDSGVSIDRSKGVEFSVDFSMGISFEQKELIKTIVFLRKAGYFRLGRCSLSGRNQDLDVDVGELSSGQQQIISSIFGLATAIEDNSLVLIDEPEISLHPRWQKDWIELLEGVLQEYKGCHVIVATHSPLLVSSANEKGAFIVDIGAESDVFVDWELGGSAGVDETLVKVFHTSATGNSYLTETLISAVANIDASVDERNESRRELLNFAKVASAEDVEMIERALKLLE